MICPQCCTVADQGGLAPHGCLTIGCTCQHRQVHLVAVEPPLCTGCRRGFGWKHTKDCQKKGTVAV